VRPHNSKEELRIVIGISSLLVVTVFLLLIIVSVPKLNYFRSLVLGFGITGTEILDSDLLTRFDLWKAGIKAYLNNGFISQLIGKGFRNTDYLNELGAWITPHNFYINSLGDFGIIGTALFIVSFIIFIIKAVYHILVSNNTYIIKFSFVAIIGLLTMNMTETFFYSPTLIIMTLLIFISQSTLILSWKKAQHLF
jgi:O-antigen ligase